MFTGDTGRANSVKNIRGPERHCAGEYNETKRGGTAGGVNHFVQAMNAVPNSVLFLIHYETAGPSPFKNYWVIMK